ncbi:DUF3768 domain-containing protein [Blastomonas sp.]|uniref:DUF3768 domain-containing protein n=1 Tax=Blastomonas sp. TaxID=1909299 RepID=UPI002586629D|nr:DUF3768 domain-containing protein [Blastomonas sp.]
MDKQSGEYRAKIRRLNDEFRCRGLGNGSVMLTPGIHGSGPKFVEDAIAATQSFDTFTRDNDPHDEHDFGAFDVGGQRLFFKIDYYSLDLQGHSPDAADPAVTHRVLTIMLATEY